ncbi:MAG: type II secretion system major pseudopilin GspG [Campylobacterota bacterium]|nr:type II secretion system major pseudopilin GspG [Campylobacterota bacterium]
MKTKKNKFIKKGFTLVELLVVIMIIALLASMVAPNLFGKLDDAQKKTTHSQLANLSTALDSFRLDFGRYPTTEEGLDILSVKHSTLKNWNGPYLVKKLKADAWDNAYVYKNPGKDGNEYTLLSYGADGKAGGSGKDADISVWE